MFNKLCFYFLKKTFTEKEIYLLDICIHKYIASNTHNECMRKSLINISRKLGGHFNDLLL